MIKYNIMSKSGKIGVGWYGWSAAKNLYESMYSKEEVDNKIFWFDLEQKIGSLELFKGITYDDFITNHKPIIMYEISYKGYGSYVEPQLVNVISEMQACIENEDEENFRIEQIKMSMFELNKLPEFTSF